MRSSQLLICGVFKLVSIFLLFSAQNVHSQDCLEVFVPNDMIICEPQDVDLIGSITGDYLEFEWTGTNGFYDDQNLITSDFVNSTTTYVFTASQLGDVNLITNGDFESGNTGFTSSYDFNPNTNVGGLGQGDYNLDVVYPFNWSGFSCPSMNGSTMMVINAAVVPNVTIYCTDVSVMPNTDYVFTVDIMTLNNPPPILQFSINGLLVGDIFNGGPQCNVEQFYQIWNSGVNTSATICIVNQSTVAGGNDFAMDNVTFTEVCKGEEQFTVTLEDFEVQIDEPLEISCDNEFIELVSTSFPDFGQQYEWSTIDGDINGNDNTPSIYVVESGLYTLTVTSQNGCTEVSSVEVFGDSDIPLFNIVGNDVLDCNNSLVFLESDLFDNNLNYTWVAPNGDETYSNFIEVSQPGLYTLTLVDPSNNCSHSEFVIVEYEDWSPLISSAVDGEIDCSNANVEVTFQIDEVFDLLTVVSPDNSMSNITDLSFIASQPGQYEYTFDYGNCTFSNTFIVAETPSFDLSISDLMDSLTCSQQNVTLSSSIMGDYENITWYNDNEIVSNDTTVNVSTPGIYIVEVVNAEGCIKVDSITVFEDIEVPIIQFEVDTISCLEPNGGFNVTTSTTDSLLWIGNNNSSSSFNPIFNQGGEYTLILFAENGCNDTSNVLLPVSENFPVITSDITNIDCNTTEGEINISSDLEADFEWSGPDTFTSTEDSIQNDMSGLYYLTLTTNEGCVLIDTFEIAIDTTSPDFDIEFDTLTCEQTFIIPNIVSDNAESFTWVFPDNTSSVENMPTLSLPGEYMITAQASNGCEASIIVSLESNVEPNGFGIGYGLLTCDNTSTYLVTDNSDLSYSLFDGTLETDFMDSILISGAGTYMVTGTNQYGCDTTLTVEIEVSGELPEFEVDHGLLICDDTTAYLVVDNPDLTYSIFDGTLNMEFTDSISITGAGTYLITGTNQFGCDSIITVELEVSEELPEFEVDHGLMICDDTTTYIVADNPDLTYSLFDGSMNTEFSDSISITGAGTYLITGTNQFGCDSTISVQIEISEELPEYGIEHEFLSCAITSTYIVVDNPNLSYSLFNGNQETIFTDSTEVTEAGTYVITGTNQWGCSKETSIEIIQLVEYPITLLEAEELNCQVTLSTVNNTNADPAELEYSWTGMNFSSNATSIEVAEVGWYYLELINDLGCSSLDSIFVSGDFNMPDIEIIGDDLLECHEQNEILSITTSIGNVDSYWIDSEGATYNENEITISEEGVYIASIENLDNGCISFDTIIIQTLEGPELEIELSLPDCPSDFGSVSEINIDGGHSPYTVLLDNESLGINSELENIEINDYVMHQLEIVDDNGCRKDTFFMIESVPNLQLELSLEQVEAGMQIITSTSFDSNDIEVISWSPNLSLSCNDCLSPIASPNETTEYTLTIVTKDGCIAESMIRVSIEPKIGISIPNTFSPNGDGINDFFTVYEKYESIKTVELFSIYDRWGNQVFELRDFEPSIPNLGWDGSFNGRDAVSGVYVYFVKVIYNSDEKESKSGTVTIIK